jgi:hypothetical protein
MQPTSYTITFSEQERDALIFALGIAFRNVREGVGQFFLSPVQYLEMSQRVMHAKPDAVAAKTQSGTQAAQQMLSRPATPPPQTPPAPEPPAPYQPRDHWAHDKKGKEQPFPEGYEAIEVEIWKMEDAPPRHAPSTQRKKITWPNGQRGFCDAFCWDASLFPWIANRIKGKATLYIVHSADKKYSNIIGIRS